MGSAEHMGTSAPTKHYRYGLGYFCNDSSANTDIQNYQGTQTVMLFLFAFHASASLDGPCSSVAAAAESASIAVAAHCT